ncbi:MAG: CDP-alcohol phosphatidyltransferase [Bacteroidales bacterium 45-6]|nr:MAG: CDP-alcohol phosphatidyltransferase [Bacteroidales bacterium 45-6]
MANRIARLIDALAHKGGIFMFLRAQFASQVASITDFTVTIVLFKIFGLFYVYATFLGSVFGGIVNCVVNYRFTFKSSDVKMKHVAAKYLLVWVCSIFLNTYGTYLVTELLANFTWLREFLGHMFDDVFLVSKLFVSLLVGLLWNYNMQRFFVYRNYNIRKTLTSIKDKSLSVTKSDDYVMDIPSEEEQQVAEEMGK